MKNGALQQRVGILIEDICKKFVLYPNKRQQKFGYYDAYKNNCQYEIKGILKKTNRVTISCKNHEILKSQAGKYIFVYYDLVNKDKELSMITDLKILEVIERNVFNVSNAIEEHGVKYTRTYFNQEKEYIRVKYEYLK